MPVVVFVFAVFLVVDVVKGRFLGGFEERALLCCGEAAVAKHENDEGGRVSLGETSEG